MKIILKHLISLFQHKWYVFRAGLMVGGIPLWRLLIHDWSKFTPSEFMAYARNFQGDYSKSPVDRERVSLDFSYAWLHHENGNPHHWGYWIPRSGKSANRPLPMPETYVREMVADWMGASRAYTRSWDMRDWLEKNLPKIGESLHPNTKGVLWPILDKLGYEIVHELNWSALGVQS